MFNPQIWVIVIWAAIDVAKSQTNPCFGEGCSSGGTTEMALLQRDVARIVLEEEQESWASEELKAASMMQESKPSSSAVAARHTEEDDEELEELGVHMLQQLVERPTIGAFQVEAESQAFAKRLRDVFAELIVKKADELCERVVSESKKWIDDLRAERLRELTDDCVGGSHSLSCASWSHTFGGESCGDTECSVKCGCMGIDELEARMQNGSIEVEDLSVRTLTPFQLEGLVSTVKYNMGKTALEFVVLVGSDHNFRAQVKNVALKAEEQVCIAIGSYFDSLFEDESPQAAVTRAIQTVGDKVSDLLASVSRQVANMVTSAMKFVFSSASLVPYIGNPLHQMLNAVADYGGDFIEERFRAFMQKATIKIMKIFINKAIEAWTHKLEEARNNLEEALPVTVMRQLEFVFNCTSAGEMLDEILEGINETVEDLFDEDDSEPADGGTQDNSSEPAEGDTEDDSEPTWRRVRRRPEGKNYYYYYYELESESF